MKPKIQAPSSFPDLESYIDYIVGNAGNMAASSPLSGASQTFTDGPFKDQTKDQVLQWAQAEGARAGLRPRAAATATPAPAAATPPLPTPQVQPPSPSPAAAISTAARAMGPIGGAIAAGIDAMTGGQNGPPRPTFQRPQTTPGATFEGIPAAQWFQQAANRQGVDNKYAQVQKPQAPAPTPTTPATATAPATPAAQKVRVTSAPAARAPIQLAAPPAPPAPQGRSAVADVMRTNGNLPRMQFSTPLPTTQPRPTPAVAAASSKRNAMAPSVRMPMIN